MSPSVMVWKSEERLWNIFLMVVVKETSINISKCVHTWDNFKNFHFLYGQRNGWQLHLKHLAVSCHLSCSHGAVLPATELFPESMTAIGKPSRDTWSIVSKFHCDLLLHINCPWLKRRACTWIHWATRLEHRSGPMIFLLHMRTKNTRTLGMCLYDRMLA